MLLVLSPAKTLDYDSAPVTERYSLPEHLEQAAELINVLRELTPAQVSELMHLSDKLAGLNVARYASWHRDFTRRMPSRHCWPSRATYTPACRPKTSAARILPSPSNTCAFSPACTGCCVRWT